jgi:hypothetical protein
VRRAKDARVSARAKRKFQEDVMKKTIGVKLTDGSYVEAVWYDDSEDGIYHRGTKIGSARTLQEAIAVVEVYAQRIKGACVQRTNVR